MALTPAGELVVNYARRLLSINDQILDFAAPPRRTSQTLRIGTTGDFTAAHISYGLARFRAQHPQSRFTVRSGTFDELMHGMRERAIDIVVWVSPTGPTFEARHYWTEKLVWLRSATLQLDPEGVVPLVSYGQRCPFTAAVIAALNSVGRDSEMVLMASSIAALGAAMASGLGVMALPPGYVDVPGVSVWENAPLPKLPEVFCGIYVRSGGGADDRNHLADLLAQALRLRGQMPGADAQIAALRATLAG